MKNDELYNILKSFKSRSEAYKHFGFSANSLGIIKLKNIAKSVDFELDTYEKLRNPPKCYCKQCNKEFVRYNGIFCSRSCSAKYTNKNKIVSDETKEKIRKSLINRNSKIVRKRICKVCGQEKCVNSDICKHSKKWFNNLIPFGFNINSLGNYDIYHEYYRIKDLLMKEYFDNYLSPKDIKEKYNYDKSFENILHTLKSFGIKTRTLSESEINACMLGKLSNYISNDKTKYQFKHGWHITWNGKKIYYRSSYELKFAKKLDDNKIDYETEYFRIKYWDSQKMKYRVAIPDFYIFHENKIVEIKSRVTFDKTNIIDKFNEYIKLGFKTLLVYENKEYLLDEIENIIQIDFNL